MKNMSYKTCTFFGHREIEITKELENKLENILQDLIVNKNFVYFYFGGFGMFDELCHQIVSKLKLKYTHIQRIYCLSDQRYLRINKRPKCLKDEDYEEFIYLPLDFDYWYQRIYFRNIEMINQSDYIIFYVKNTQRSGAYKAFQYALKMKKDYINISKN